MVAQGIAGFLNLAPNRHFQLVAAPEPAFLAHQDFEQFQTLGRELERLALPAHFAAYAIERQRANPLNRGDNTPLRAPDQRLNPHLQFFQGKRLVQIIVCTRVKAIELVIERIARSQQQDRHGLAQILAQALKQGQAVDAGQANVENHGVKAGFAQEMQRRQAIGRGIGLITARGQKIINIGGDFGVVFNDEDAGVHDFAEWGDGAV